MNTLKSTRCMSPPTGDDPHGDRISPFPANRPFHGFFQLLTWTSSGKSVEATEKSAFKWVKLPSFKAICWNLMKIQLLKVATFLRLFFQWCRRIFPDWSIQKVEKNREKIYSRNGSSQIISQRMTSCALPNVNFVLEKTEGFGCRHFKTFHRNLSDMWRFT